MLVSVKHCFLSFNKNKLKSKYIEKIAIKDWQCNMIEELMYVSEHYLENNLDKRELCTMLKNVSIL